MTHPLLAQLGRHLGSDIALAEGDPAAPLWGEEDAYVAKAIPKRQAEFAAGRSAARAAMTQLGHPATAILRHPNRSPIWPTTLLGSITHTKDLCFAAVARTATTAALGVDAEQANPLSDAIRKSILIHPREQEADPLTATAIFSAKEAVYKALSPYLDTIWGFDAMHITFDGADHQFIAHLNHSAGPWSAGASLPGIVLSDGKHIVTACALDRRAGTD